MSDDRNHAERPETPLSFVNLCVRLWALPAAIGIAAFETAWRSALEHRPARPAVAKDGQLVMPDPIADSDEHALLA